MDDDVARLVREQRLLEAAALATERRDPHTASELLERACAWKAAARAALAAGELGRALVLAALGDADDTAREALDGLMGAPKSELDGLATGLVQRGRHAWAARTFEAAESYTEAAESWERAGDVLRAAHLLETRAGSDGAAAAARLLDTALRRGPDRPDVRVVLGGLLLRCGRAAPALRVLQRVAEDAEESRDALQLSLTAVRELGMMEAAAELGAKLARLGITPTSLAAPTEPGRRDSPRTRLYGRYEVIREVSSTATARLVEAEDTLRGERVAVKIFSADARYAPGGGRDAIARFAREARVLAEVAHPNIVPLRDVIGEGPAIVLAWMPGGTLQERLAAEPFTPARAVDVACAVLHALAEAHRLGVVHRDIKPANILFDAAGTARLSDFGVAHLGDLSVTATAGFFGSLAYMSPEQREGRPATAQSDLFGVGVVLFEMLAGRRPIARDEREEPLAKFHKYLDARHDAVIASLIARDPKARPPDAFAAARALADLPWLPDHDPAEARPKPSLLTPTSGGPTGPPGLYTARERLAGIVPGERGSDARDLWLDRPVACVPLTEHSLARASVFARVGHRALQPILRVDRDSGTVWLGVPRGEPLDRPLLGFERAILEEMLALLHAEGLVHGAIDRSAIVLGSSGPVLLFPFGDPGGSADADRAALRDL
jgi:serine/threonine-protein kinase